MQQNKELFILSPFEIPDVKLTLKTIEAGAYPVLHLGRDKSKAVDALDILSKSTKESFGVCFTPEMTIKLELPSNVSKVIYPYGMDVAFSKNIELFCQIHSIEEAEAAIEKGLKNIIVKGNEGAGKVAYKSSFILFQAILHKYSNKDINIYIQGGAGIHTSAAFLALGAKGVIMDSQIAVFSECSAPKGLKDLCKKLSGNETRVIDNFRVLVRNNSPVLPVNGGCADILPFLGEFDLSKNLIPMGQDVSLSVDFFDNYKSLKNLVTAFQEAIYGHLAQAKELRTIQPNSKLAKDLGTKYPVAQGPMARVSDVPEFANSVAEAGALPFVAMSMVVGDSARTLMTDTQKMLGNKPWGVGILGFVPAKIRDEQTKYILEAKPSVVLIAGGRPSLAKPFEQEGITVFLHVPSASLLDMFLKEKARNFIFEGRESGGHIGPILSTVLWEKQICRLLKEDNLSSTRLFFAGGIHDALSSAFVSIMTSTLAVRGAKIGVLMGSSYIYTKEAVDSGAILPEFQRQAIVSDGTVSLEAAPGQETRSLKSPFTAFFQEEKERLQTQYSDSKEVWLRLEDLNLGRLRIAAKGIERIGSDLVKLDKEEQAEKGLYMMGQIAAIRNNVITVDELHNQVAVENNELLAKLDEMPLPTSNATPLDVAIVGISGIFPDAKNIEEFWRNIILGKDCITEVPDSRWNKELYYNPNTRDTDYVSSKWGGFIPSIDFDPLEFGMTPQSLASIEPTQLLSLLTAKRALVDAGYTNLAEVDLDNTSVIFGAEGSTELAASYGFRAMAKQVFGEMPDEFKNALPKLNEDSFAGVLSNVISGRIANRLNLGGRNYTVDAACASSLAALDLACQELFLNRSDMVIVGGTDLHNGINDFLMFSCTHALSRKGYSASFDADSDGIALGEGIGVLVLKKLEDAERDGNKIYAVIKGVGGSSDGRSLGMTAPNRKGQIKALQRAYQSAGIFPSQVEMVEAHGTGTVVGDKTELSALTDMFLESGAVKGQSALGSVKTQIGHAKCAAGIAGVIKAALSLYYGVQPPTIHLNNPNPYYDKETSPFAFNTQAGVWNSEKRIAGVSAFGFGGTNFHVVMQNHKHSELYSSMNLWPSELFVFRGNTLAEAKQLLQNVKQLLQYNDTVSIKDIAYSLVIYNDKPIQLSVVANDSKDLLDKVKAALADKADFGVYFKDAKEGKVAFMFSGQGSQRANMARDLFVAFPAMRRLLAQNREYEKVIFPHTVFDDATKKEQQSKITDTRNAQPLLGMVDLAIADFLKSLGIVPDMVAGHSYGELPALCFAGAFASDKLVSLSKNRALSILNAVEEDKGKMIAVNVPEAELSALLEGETEVWAVNFNSYKQTVLAGSTKGLTAFMQKLTQKNVGYKELNVACAFHSPLLNKSKALYSKVLADIKFGQTTIPVWSNTTAEYYPATEKDIKERLSDHLIKPVLFTKQVENMYAAGAKIFIETGPGKVLTGLVQSMLGDKVTTLETENKAFNGVSFILHTVAKYIATGRLANVEKLFTDRGASVIDLNDPAQYQKKSTIWYINGHNAVPSNGKMPASGAYPITQPLNLNVGNGANMGASIVPTVITNSASDQVVLEYLNGMKNMLQNQRDVMLGYLGYNPPANEVIISTPIQTQSVTPSTPVKAITAQPVAIPQTRPVSAPVAAPAQAKISVDQIKTILLDIVSEKTGYPADMLGMDLDLEGDLSIDSIKRMEIIGALRDKLNITGSLEDSEDAIEKMAAVKTLNGLIGWIEELIESNKGQAAPVASAPASVSVDQIKTILLDIVSEKTGYPTEMLGMDLDLEGDLSIDSIKRMEIIGALRDKLNITGSLEDSEDAIEKMAAVKTLNGLIGWIEELIASNTPVASAQSAPVQTGIVSAATTPAPAAVSIDQIKAILLDTVSEKTGYPAEMLGMDLDLEGDLSIDSIKRMEIIGALRERLNITGSLEDSEDAIEKMAAVKTLNGLIDWIQELIDSSNGQSASAPTAPVQAVAPVAASVTEAPATAAISIDQIKALLLDTVSEKTGYPVEMLGMDLDLEADLSIDSIKRMEIVGALRERLNITGSLENSEDAIEKMAEIKTLNGLIGWIEELANGKVQEDTRSIREDKAAVEETSDGGDLIRMSFKLEERFLDSSVKLQINEKRFALTDDGGAYAAGIKALLEKNGAVVDLISGNEELSIYDGLIVLNASKSSAKYTISQVFNMIKHSDLGKMKWIYTFSDLLADIQEKGNIDELKEIQGFPGLIKSLNHEFPDINFRAVVFQNIFENETLPQVVLDELLTREVNHIEIVYKDMKRYTFNPTPEALDMTVSPHLPLNKDSVVLVFGGAQGITPSLLEELSKECPCNYILVGRSEAPSAEFEQYKDLDSKDKIRKHLIAVEQMRSPAEIEKKIQKIFKSNQIRINLESISKTGAKAIYKSLDLKDEEGLRSFIRETYKTYGKIDGIFHAAGLLDDKLFIHKTIESFEQVYSTKITPLHVLLEELKTDLKLFVMFSSVASSYGNRGQSDYASANSVFDMAASILDDKLDARILTINWGPWKGSGMVSDALEAEFKKRGVSLIPLKAGAKYFVNELKYGKETHVLVMGGAEDVKNFLRNS